MLTIIQWRIENSGFKLKNRRDLSAAIIQSLTIFGVIDSVGRVIANQIALKKSVDMILRGKNRIDCASWRYDQKIDHRNPVVAANLQVFLF